MGRNAILASSGYAGVINPRLSAGFDEFNKDEIIGWPAWPSLGSTAQINTLQWIAPAAPHVRKMDAIHAPAYVHDFYYRIHITPIKIDLGNVSSAQGFNVVVWNAYFEPKKILSLSGIQTGMSVTPPKAMPFFITGLQETDWGIEVTTDGDPQIDVTITWNFEDVEAPKVHITGMRVIMWPFMPDWSKPIEETLEWATEVLTSTSGAEQRRSLRISPRRYYQAHFVLFKHDRQYFEMCMSANGAGSWALPLWAELQHINEELKVEDIEIKCITQHREFRPGTMVVLRSADVNDVFKIETGIVDAVLADRITLQRPLQQSWPVGSRLYPARSARIVEQPTIEYITDEHAQTSIDFISIETNDWQAKAPLLQYRGHSVFLDKPNEASNLTTQYLRMLKELDNTSGIPVVTDTAKASFSVQQHDVFLMGEEELNEFKQLLYALRGKQTAMWIPTHKADMSLAQDSANDILYIQKMGYTHFGFNLVGKRDVVIELTDGSISMHRIIETLEVGEVERLTVEPLLPQTVTLKNIGRISFLMLSRLDTDSVTLEHTTDITGLTRASIVWKSLRDELEV